MASLCSGVCHRATRSEVDTTTRPHDSLTYNLNLFTQQDGVSGWIAISLLEFLLPQPPTQTPQRPSTSNLANVMGAGEWDSVSDQKTCQVLAVPVVAVPGAQLSTQHQMSRLSPPALSRGHCFNR